MKSCDAVLVSYNNLESVIKTIERLQLCGDYLREIIVVDSSQDDEIRNYITKLTSSVPIRLVWQCKSGIFSAMNLGASFSNAHYLWFCNPGDFPLGVNFFEEIFDGINNEKLDWFVGQAKLSNENFWFPTNDTFTGLEVLMGDAPISHQSFICSSFAFNAVGGFNLKLKFSADLEFIYKLITNFRGRAYLIPFVEVEFGGSSYKQSRQVIFETFLIRWSVKQARGQAIRILFLRILESFVRRLWVKTFH